MLISSQCIRKSVLVCFWWPWLLCLDFRLEFLHYQFLAHITGNKCFKTITTYSNSPMLQINQAIGTYLDTMIMCLSAIVSAVSMFLAAVIHWAVPHESMLQRVISLLVPLVMSNCLFFANKHLPMKTRVFYRASVTIKHDNYYTHKSHMPIQFILLCLSEVNYMSSFIYALIVSFYF